MPEKNASFVIEECQAEPAFPSLASAQQDALHPLAADLAATLRSLISSGLLAVENGRVVVKNGNHSGSSLDDSNPQTSER